MPPALSPERAVGSPLSLMENSMKTKEQITTHITALKQHADAVEKTRRFAATLKQHNEYVDACRNEILACDQEIVALEWALVQTEFPVPGN